MTRPVFTEGSPLRHILVMTASSGVGLVTLFLVDLVDIYFLSLLGEQELAAAVGFSGTLMFFLTSMSIGLSIGMGARVSQALGRRDVARARELCTHSLMLALGLTFLASLAALHWNRELLAALGAEGRTLDLAVVYTNILLPSTAFLGGAISLAAALRACGDARRSMYATLCGGLVNAVLDPIFIFGFDWGIAGAAWASFLARVTIIGIALWHIVRHHQLLTRPRPPLWASDSRFLLAVSGPAMLTNLATPIGNSYVMFRMADFGDSAVAGASIIGRLVPVAFGVLFALSGAVGPIVGQNLGAGLYHRVRQTVWSAVGFTAVYVALMWLLLWLLSDWIVWAFDASGSAEMLIQAYCSWMCLLFFFTGLLFVCNATFNNLDSAPLATLFNFARSLLGTLPLVTLGAWALGPIGVLLGDLAGAAVWGCVALAVLARRIGRLEREHHRQAGTEVPVEPGWPWSSGRTAMGQQSAAILENDPSKP